MRLTKISLSPDSPTPNRALWVEVLVAEKVFIDEKKGRGIGIEITREVGATTPGYAGMKTLILLKWTIIPTITSLMGFFSIPISFLVQIS